MTAEDPPVEKEKAQFDETERGDRHKIEGPFNLYAMMSAHSSMSKGDLPVMSQR